MQSVAKSMVSMNLCVSDKLGGTPTMMITRRTRDRVRDRDRQTDKEKVEFQLSLTF